MVPSGDSNFIYIPIFDEFDLFVVFEEANKEGPSALVAVHPGTKFDDDSPVRFGGMLREAEFEGEPEPSQRFYLEVMYLTRL